MGCAVVRRVPKHDLTRRRVDYLAGHGVAGRPGLKLPAMRNPAPSVGEMIRDWRLRRRMTQMDLALEAEISTRHLSFLETGRSAPSREMVLRLAEQLDAPLRARNAMLLAAGFAPAFAENALSAPQMDAVRGAVERLLAAHEPFPALAMDGRWTLVAANSAINLLLAGVDEGLLRPPVNVARLALSPLGLAPRIANLAQWRSHLLERLTRQAEASDDPALADLAAELTDLPAPADSSPPAGAGELVAIPLRLRSEAGLLTFWSASLAFGGPQEVTVSELTLETFLPADAETSERLARLAGRR